MKRGFLYRFFVSFTLFVLQILSILLIILFSVGKIILWPIKKLTNFIRKRFFKSKK